MSGEPIPAPAEAAVAPKDISELKITATPEERAAIATLKGRVGDAMARACPRWRSDVGLLRVLRAKKLNIEAAETMYRDLVYWREQAGVDTIVDTFKPPPQLDQFLSFGFHGLDRDGHPVIVQRMGNM